MLKVNSINPSFRGVWGEVRFVNEKPVVNYYPLMGETEEETKTAVKGFHDNSKRLLPKWYEKEQKVEVIVSEPLKVTKEALAKLNRGYISDALAKLLK